MYLEKHFSSSEKCPFMEVRLETIFWSKFMTSVPCMARFQYMIMESTATDIMQIYELLRNEYLVIWD